MLPFARACGEDLLSSRWIFHFFTGLLSYFTTDSFLRPLRRARLPVVPRDSAARPLVALSPLVQEGPLVPADHHGGTSAGAGVTGGVTDQLCPPTTTGGPLPTPASLAT